MNVPRHEDCCILNSGPGSWAFEPLARSLASALGVEICDTPRSYNYLLHWESGLLNADQRSFIPIESIEIAADKRRLAAAFTEANVPTPETLLIPSFAAAVDLVRTRPEKQWCLKYPTGCGGKGHRLLSPGDSEPPNWPKPFVVQEFIRLPEPEVYRTYCADGELFGWMVRRFPKGKASSPWVAHARGARYARLEAIPDSAVAASRSALACTGLMDSFGCADLIQRPTGEWLVLEVGTDGLFNHADRDLGDPEFEAKLLHKVAASFWNRARSSS